MRSTGVVIALFVLLATQSRAVELEDSVYGFAITLPDADGWTAAPSHGLQQNVVFAARANTGEGFVALVETMDAKEELGDLINAVELAVVGQIDIVGPQAKIIAARRTEVGDIPVYEMVLGSETRDRMNGSIEIRSTLTWVILANGRRYTLMGVQAGGVFPKDAAKDNPKLTRVMASFRFTREPSDVKELETASDFVINKVLYYGALMLGAIIAFFILRALLRNVQQKRHLAKARASAPPRAQLVPPGTTSPGAPGAGAGAAYGTPGAYTAAPQGRPVTQTQPMQPAAPAQPVEPIDLDTPPEDALRNAIRAGNRTLALDAWQNLRASGATPNLLPEEGLQLARMLEAEGDALSAAKVAHAAANQDLKGPHAPMAIFTAARLLSDKAGKPENGMALYKYLIENFPDHELAGIARQQMS